MTNKKKSVPGLSPFIVAGVLLVLVPIFGIMTMDSIREQNSRIVEKLIGKGTFLMRAFEAGSRTGMMTMSWGVARVQSLLVETAHQPGVRYMMITDDKGTILAHSDPEQQGARCTAMPEISAMDETSGIRHRELVKEGGTKVFEVFKVFTPARRMPGPGPGRKMCRMMEERPRRHHGGGGDWFSAHFSDHSAGECPARGRQFIFAGLDMESAEFGKQQYLNHVVLTGAGLFLIGCFGIVGLFVLQGYRSTRSSLTRVRAFSNKVVETMPAGLISVNLDLEVTSCNSGALSILYGAEGPAVAPVVPGLLLAVAETVKQGGETVEREVALTSPSNHPLLLDVTASPIPDDQGKVSGVLLLFRDLTELRTLKTEIERSRRLAAVGKLAAGVAHEIRNPLSSIKGFATYFRERYKDVAEDREIADIMVHEVERLNRSITQLLEFAKPVPVVAKAVNLSELVAHSLKLVESDLKNKGITAEQAVDTDREHVTTDPDRLNQILLNLYLNAVQAMDTGGKLSVVAATSDRHLLMEVRDTGKGIAPSAMDHIFDPYYTTRAEGTGLGLAMVHRAVEALDGEIRVESREGKGTVFFLKLPLKDD
ncbi:MAG: PAS domain-containing protein [Desulfobacteraceae bacterium]|nr:PAS domain-containing protein [Desulfobacteraceae bacterium]